ncbi:LysR substrate-binding domain-containing protein [Tsukamurella strandjordii]|uniref:LysR substrate-binding domain-containing protein n=1 Tax=Tsukamurella strandjordii TaxID=147577 RepID=A0AA90NFF3_9ACTN|nr:LysR substrate-binding domain-containing protein [Tsukamurella strandjordii]MDP0397391.1 LysR substrate-binding domain-containing protein [Tsukamurella strandjordii]
MLDVHRLRLLRELSLRGTIAAVAQALDYTPSAVSQQLTTLEREAGTPLLERTGRSVRLTEAGRLLVGHADAVLARLEQARADLDALGGSVTGELRIGAYPSAMRTVITPALIRLSADHPQLRVRVTEIDPATAPEALRSGKLDVALLHRYDCLPGRDDPSLDTEPLFEEAVHLATPADSTGALADFAAAQWISGTVGTMCDDATVRTCEAAGFTPRVRHRTDDFAAVLALVDAGQGVAIVPDVAAADAPPTVRLAPLDIRRRTALAYRRGAAGDPLVGAARSALTAR